MADPPGKTSGADSVGAEKAAPPPKSKSPTHSSQQWNSILEDDSNHKTDDAEESAAAKNDASSITGVSLSNINNKKRGRSWDESFEALKRYKEKHGDTLVPIHNCKEDFSLGGWVNQQRTRQKKLTTDQRNKLNSIGFVWSVRARNQQWNGMMEKLRVYKREYGDCNVPRNYQVDPELGEFVEKTRSIKNRLSSRRRKQLDDLGFWGDDVVVEVEAESASDSSDSEGEEEEEEAEGSGEEEEEGEEDDDDEDEWFQQYQKIMEYHDEHGHSKVPIMDDEFGKWVTAQRRKYAKNLLSTEHLELLQDVQFDFTLPKKEPKATDAAKASKKRKKEDQNDQSSDSSSEDGSGSGSDSDSGDSSGSGSTESNNDDEGDGDDNDDTKPHKKPKLVDFRKKRPSISSSIRSNSNQGSADDVDDQSSLEDIEADDISDTTPNGTKLTHHDKRWYQSFRKLHAYHKKYGHCRVQQSGKHKQLGAWVANQRHMYARDKHAVKPDRKKLLDDLGFVWDAQKNWKEARDRKWNRQYAKLLEFKEKFGHCRVPQNDQYKDLGSWVANHRQLYSKNSIRDDRLKLLNDIGFVWNAKEYMGRRLELDQQPVGGAVPASKASHPILSPLLKQLCEKLQKDGSEEKENFVDQYKRQLEQMIVETEQRVKDSAGNDDENGGKEEAGKHGDTNRSTADDTKVKQEEDKSPNGNTVPTNGEASSKLAGKDVTTSVKQEVAEVTSPQKPAEDIKVKEEDDTSHDRDAPMTNGEPLSKPAEKDVTSVVKEEHIEESVDNKQLFI